MIFLNGIYTTTKEAPKSIEWDWLENRYICSRGNCYKTIEDIPKEFRHIVKDKHVVTVPEQLYMERSTSCPCPWGSSFD